MMKFISRSVILFFCSALLGGAVFPQTTAFSYQGRLTEIGSPVTGTRYFRFTLFDENGTAIPGATVEQTLTVTNGVFTTSLDFGAPAFPGANRSLQISVKINAGDPFTDLTPRQDILAAPYSIKSKEADNAAQLGGVDSARFVQQDAGGSVSIGGNLTVAGAVTYDTVNATTQYNLGGQRILGTTAGSGNFYAGLGAGQSNTTGIYNTFVGTIAGRDNTTGTSNSFFGYNTGLKNTDGLSNSFFGDGAGKENVIGNANSFFGNQAGFQNKANFNSFFGYVAGQFNTTGVSNSFFGAYSGQYNTTGSNNSFFGYQSGLGNVNGVFNAFFGRTAGFANTSGSSNTFVGAAAGENNTTGSSNTFVGAAAGGGPCPLAPCAVTLTGSKNSFFGESSGINNTSGANNVFLGATSGAANTTGADNTFVGTNSGAVNVAGSQNAFFGREAGRNNLAGFNSFFGFSAGNANTNGSYNAYFGNSAGLSNITGNNNAYFGTGAGDTATGSGNTAIGDNAGVTFFVGTTNTNGNYNTFLGSLARPSIGNLTNANAIGAYAFVSANNSMILGSINGINGATADTNVGIGTTAPQTRLQIKTASGNYGFTQTDGAITVGSYVGGSSSGATGGWLGTLSNNKLFFFSNSGQASMTVDTNGNVGIGTIAPASKFTVAGLIETTTGGVKFPDGTIQTSAFTGTSNSFIQNTTTQQAASNFNISGNGIVGGNLTFGGTLNGSGANLTNLNASSITTGTLSNARLGIIPFANGGTGLSAVGATGNFLRSNGAAWTSSPILAADIPTNLTGYIQNTNTPQTGANFNVAGNGTVGGTLTANKVQATSDSFVLGSFGIGTTAPRAKLDVTGGNILVDSPGNGIILKSPDANTCRLLTIDNAGAIALTSVVCP